MRHALFRSLLVMTSSLSLTAATALPTMAATNTVGVEPNAELIARGAAVQVGISYSCPPGSASVSIHLEERVSAGRIADGFAFAGGLTCDGGGHIAQVLVLPQFGIAFKKGPGVVTGDLRDFTCSNSQFSGTVSIK
jgi:hypothetical protein